MQQILTAWTLTGSCVSTMSNIATVIPGSTDSEDFGPHTVSLGACTMEAILSEGWRLHHSHPSPLPDCPRAVRWVFVRDSPPLEPAPALESALVDFLGALLETGAPLPEEYRALVMDALRGRRGHRAA
jgi:hypothetical protein